VKQKYVEEKKVEEVKMLIVLEICPRGNNKAVIIIFQF
jgi:hypothetical protein